MDTIKLLLGAAALATTSGAMLLAAGPAHAHARDVTVVASAEDDVPVARVGLADLNLTVAAGQQTMRRRVSGAIRTVCAPTYDGTEATRLTECQNHAWNQARPQMAAAVARAGRIASGNATAQDRSLALNTLNFAGR